MLSRHIQKIVLIVPAPRVGGTEVQSLMKNAAAETLARIHAAMPAPREQERGLSDIPVVELRPVCPLSSDTGPLRGVNVHMASDIPAKTLFARIQQAANIIGHPVRGFVDNVSLRAFGRELFFTPGQKAYEMLELAELSQAYVVQYGSLFNGPDGTRHLTAAYKAAHERVWLYGDPQDQPAVRPMSNERFAELYPAPDLDS